LTGVKMAKVGLNISKASDQMLSEFQNKSNAIILDAIPRLFLDLDMTTTNPRH